MKKYYYLILVGCILNFSSLFAQQTYTGKIVAAHNKMPIKKAYLNIVGVAHPYITDSAGYFKLDLNKGLYTVTISHQAYEQKTVQMSLPVAEPLTIELIPIAAIQLNEVQIQTGYQSLPAERATGAFTLVNESLINRSVGVNILDRLQNLVPSLSFNKVGTSSERLNISIRGQSTLSANADPLIILDNFVYEGDMNAINPDDIESISILKDAAAASIWGARAGNGVIVLTSKKGKNNQKIQINASSSFNLIEKPNLFYKRKMSTGDYIDIQTKLFTQGYYNTLEQNDIKNLSHTALPPLIEILIAKRDQKITPQEAEAQIAVLKNNDVRHDIDKYLYQTGQNQQYALNIRGGGTNNSFYISAGADKNASTLKGNGLDRFSFQANQNWILIHNKLNLSTNLFYTQLNNRNNALNYTYTDPYVMLADKDGNPISVPTLRNGFIESAKNKGLLDWNYIPLTDRTLNDKTTKTENIRFDTGIKYTLLSYLTADVLYQFTEANVNAKTYYNPDSYYTRDLINKYTQLNADGSLTRPIPLGGILSLDNGQTLSHSLRTQLNYKKSFGTKHQLNGIAGYEIRKANTISRGYRLYGYDDEHASSAIVDYVTLFPSFSVPASKIRISNTDSNTELTDRFISYYSNLAYTFNDKYTLSASARFDQSNLFGVKTNQKGTPLYSIGSSWWISRERFFSADFVNSLKLRLTYGYNGNIDRRLSAYTTAAYLASSTNSFNALIKQPYAQIQNPPNPQLRWERVEILNLATDFELFNRFINGSIDIYSKKGIDLIGDTPFPPSSGITSFRGNYANTTTKGIDVAIESHNIQGKFKWTTNANFAYINNKVSKYEVKGTLQNYLSGSGYPLLNRPIHSLYSYEWAGLDPNNGNPLGYLNGTPSADYAKIIAAYKPETLIYQGSTRPTHFGAIRNSFSYANLTLSCNISFKWNYVFRRSSISYGPTFGMENGHADYTIRWKQPGDEKITQVPSVPASNVSNRDNFYALSSVLVERGDHIRLEDIRLNYTLPAGIFSGKYFNQLQFYIYSSNLGLLYKKTKYSFDPEFPNNDIKPGRNLAIGLKLGF